MKAESESKKCTVKKKKEKKTRFNKQKITIS